MGTKIADSWHQSLRYAGWEMFLMGKKRRGVEKAFDESERGCKKLA